MTYYSSYSYSFHTPRLKHIHYSLGDVFEQAAQIDWPWVWSLHWLLCLAAAGLHSYFHSGLQYGEVWNQSTEEDTQRESEKANMDDDDLFISPLKGSKVSEMTRIINSLGHNRRFLIDFFFFFAFIETHHDPLFLSAHCYCAATVNV